MSEQKKSARLASRFKAALQREEELAREQEAAQRAAARVAETRKAALDAAWEDLVGELRAFVEELGDADLHDTERGLRLSRGEQAIRLTRVEGAEEIGVEFDGSEGEDRLVYDLSERRWYLDLARARLVFFDEGFEELMIVGLGLPRPESAPLPPEPVSHHQAPPPTAVVERPSESRPAPTRSGRNHPTLGSSIKEHKDWWA